MPCEEKIDGGGTFVKGGKVFVERSIKTRFLGGGGGHGGGRFEVP